MNDLDVLKAMFRRADIAFTEGVAVDNADNTTLTTRADDGPNNKGYMGFETVMTFTKEGALLDIGAWE
jgi:hypothetical protein